MIEHKELEKNENAYKQLEDTIRNALSEGIDPNEIVKGLTFSYYIHCDAIGKRRDILYDAHCNKIVKKVLTEEIQKNLNDANPYLKLAYFILGSSESNEKEAAELLEKATKIYEEKATKIDQNSFKTYYTLGRLYCNRLGQYEKAVDVLKKATKIDPNSEGAHYLLANSYSYLSVECKEDKEEAKRKYDEKAIEEYKKVIQLNPNGSLMCDVGIALGSIYMSLKRNEEAIEVLSKAIEKESNCMDARAMRSRIYHKLNQPEKAIEDDNILEKYYEEIRKRNEENKKKYDEGLI